MSTPGAVCQRPTRRSGSGNGSDLRRTPLTMVKMAVLAPMPRASVSTVAAANIGVRARRLAA
jgi:hypothetical protein